MLTGEARARLAATGARFDEPLARHTTYCVGGPADAYAEPADEAALAALLGAAGELPVTFVGAGSNLLVRDGGVRGLVIATRRLARLERDRDAVRAGAGLPTAHLLRACTEWELGGVEFLAGVPGSVGGGARMNAGTTLGCFADVVRRVRSLGRSGAPVERDGAGCGFAYRASGLPDDEVVVEVELALHPRPRAEIEAACVGLRAKRKGAEPHGVLSAGSFFKNPPGDHAGRLIEQAGLKGRSVGAAFVSEVHANWLVHQGGASAADILALAEIVGAEVKARFGVHLEREVRVIGETLTPDPSPRGRGEKPEESA